MPAQHYTPRYAIASGFDASQWAGENVFSRGGTNIALPSDAGLYDDAVVFLNGLGSNATDDVSLGSGFDANWTGAAGTGTAYINANDRVVLEHDGASFTLGAAAGNAVFGFNTAGQSSVFTGTTNRITASAEWTRGIVENPNLSITPAASAAFDVLSSDAHVVQSIPTLIRAYNEGDADALAPTSNLEYLDNAAVAGLSDTARWSINADGHVQVSWETGLGGAFAWVSTSFRDRLGFSGRESVTNVGAADVLVADNPLPGFIVPPRPMVELVHGYAHSTSARRLRGGDVAASEITDWYTFKLSGYMGGPADPDNDETNHWRIHVLPYIRPGRYVSIYQDWGDPRRARFSRVRASGDEPYSVLYTSEFNGRRGRVRCVRSPDDGAAFTTTFNSPIRLRFLVELMLEERKD